MRRLIWTVAAVLPLTPFLCGQQRQRLHPVPKSDQGLTTGPEVGEQLPGFEALDQHGRLQTFEDLKGPKGLVLLVVRSADW